MNTHDFFQNTFSKLFSMIRSEEDKITIVSKNYLGFPTLLHCRMTDVMPSGYAQYDDGIEIIFKKRGGRTPYRATFYGSDDYCATPFAIFSGWQESSWQPPKSWVSFDKSMLYGMVDGMNQKTKICEYSERIFAEERAKLGKIYRVVYIDGTGKWQTEEFANSDDLVNAFQSSETFHSIVVRNELQGAPVLDHFCGPMYDGMTDDGKSCIVRYESQEVFGILSR